MNKKIMRARLKWLKPAILLTAVVIMAVLARVFGLDRSLGQMRGWIDARGAWAPFIFAGVYALASVAAIPGSALTIAAGALFGSVIGVITVIFGATLGASLCFLIARYFARDAVAESMQKRGNFKKLYDLTARHGDIIVAITRLVPIFPFNMLNYGFGLTGVRFRTYVLWSFICMLPGTIMYVVGSDAVVTAIGEQRVPWSLILVILLVGAVLAMLIRKARHRLKSDGQPDKT